ncbi:hypothetical protein NDU88_007519 [Pleurodeles waltl]|uniref:Uncharacterized protein n=1 Tax=Pleurodeles waltl TaxID=8319 RepID=A0AAV7NTA5_PLEWA|nr:hypothetical protein NDU88_007519 [Pleurodeles waltl]
MTKIVLNMPLACLRVNRLRWPQELPSRSVAKPQRQRERVGVRSALAPSGFQDTDECGSEAVSRAPRMRKPSSFQDIKVAESGGYQGCERRLG